MGGSLAETCLDQITITTMPEEIIETVPVEASVEEELVAPEAVSEEDESTEEVVPAEIIPDVATA